MIVRQFLQWVQFAPPEKRAEATSALARAFLYSDLSHEDRDAMAAAMLSLLDDPAVEVRLTLAEELARSDRAPLSVILALAHDISEVSQVVCGLSPLLHDGELVDIVGLGSDAVRQAIAQREVISAPLSAAIAAVGDRETVLALLVNPGAALLTRTLDHCLERFGDDEAVRTAIMGFEGLEASTHQALIVHLAEAQFAAETDGLLMSVEQRERLRAEARDVATIQMAAQLNPASVRPLAAHLRKTGQLTTQLLLRGLLSGNVTLIEESLAELADLPVSRVSGLIGERHGAGFRAAYKRAGLPGRAYPAFQAAIQSWHDEGGDFTREGRGGLVRVLCEKTLERYETIAESEFDPTLALLRRFCAEAARREARRFTSDLIAQPEPEAEVLLPDDILLISQDVAA